MNFGFFSLLINSKFHRQSFRISGFDLANDSKESLVETDGIMTNNSSPMGAVCSIIDVQVVIVGALSHAAVEWH